ncbi:MAG: M48 family metalloprotease [Betaproteobacteria bacterium]|nr:M48 family metalloprotease [Betaproteobacteria bacterium]
MRQLPSALLLILAVLASGAQAAGLGGLLRGVLDGVQPQSQAQPADAGVGNLVQALAGGQTSAEEEADIGRRIAGNLLGAAPLVADEGLQRYVNRVGRWVAGGSERPELVWRFGVIDSEDINAFAAPGGYVFVTKGLYKKLRNEAELAAVLGHEIGHVLRRHHLKLMQQSQMVSAVGGLLGQRLRDKNQIVQNLIGNGAEIVARSLDKDAEYEADRMGMVLAARAGYDGYALPAVLQEIGHVPAQDSRMALLYKTHPHPEDRLTRLGEAVASTELPDGRLVENRLYRLK